MSEVTTESPEGPGEVRRRSRTRWLLIGIVVVALVAVGTIVVLTRLTSGASAAATTPLPDQMALVPVTKTDLSEQQTIQGTLGYGGEFTVTGYKAGTITTLPAPGTEIKQGQSLYTVDALPVPLFYGALPFYRPLTDGMDKGPDVKILEQNLKTLGFFSGAPDDKFTSQDTASIKKWQKSLKLPETGTLSPGDVVVQTGPIRTGETSVSPGAPATGPLFKATGTDHLVEVELPSAKQHIAKEGEKVALTITGGKATTGKISLVKNASDPDAKPGQGGGDTAKVKVVITLDDQSAAAGLASAPVSVVFTTGVRKEVLTVPVNALLALAEGGNGLEVVENGKHVVVAVKTGLFANGKVEVSGPGIAEGTKVVTTS